MHRTVIALSMIAAIALSLCAMGQESVELRDLHLVSWEEIPRGRPSFMGPVSAAILMAWHADHGYRDLLPDMNKDGHIDERDTIVLAESFAPPMGGHEGRVWDPKLVDVVARYVAERYPGVFELWIYDPSFPEEYRDHMGRSFRLEEYSGIVFRLLGEPSWHAYVEHLEHDRPGVVGMGWSPEPNDFAVSRSARLIEEPNGWPVDLANTSHEAFGPGPIWESLVRQTFSEWAFDRGDWIPFETLIVLVPVRESGEPHNVPGDGPGDPGDNPGGDPDPGDDPSPGDPGDNTGGDPDPGDDPNPTLLPNLWVTDVTGCWYWSTVDGREHVIGVVEGVVHNGGQADASNVRVRISANGVLHSMQISSTLSAGSAAGVTAAIDLGPYDTMSWPVQLTITADPDNLIPEADETNNTTVGAFPQSNSCD